MQKKTGRPFASCEESPNNLSHSPVEKYEKICHRFATVSEVLFFVFQKKLKNFKKIPKKWHFFTLFSQSFFHTENEKRKTEYFLKKILCTKGNLI